MRKHALYIILMIALIAGCAGGSRLRSDISLDDSIMNAAEYVTERLPGKSRIAILSITSPTDELSQYIYDEFTANLLETGRVTVIDRREIDSIRDELRFQTSGEVSDDSMQSLGKLLGAQFMVSGSFTDLGDVFRLVVRVFNVENGTVELQYRTNVDGDDDLAWTLIEG